MSMQRRTLIGSVAIAALPAATASAAITEFRGVETQAAWEAAAGSWQTMDFTGFDAGHHLTDEYEASLGVVFTTPRTKSQGRANRGFRRTAGAWCRAPSRLTSSSSW